MALPNPDVFAAASHRNMIEHLCGPFVAGAVESPIVISAAGRIDISGATREPVLLIAPAVALGEQRMQVDVTLDPEGAATVLPPLQFDCFTEEGAFVPVHAPTVDPGTRMAAPFKLALTVSFRDRDDLPLAVPVPDVAVVLEARLLEGSFGKMLFALGAEKQRLRRQVREVLTMRALSTARWDALDRFGADLAVPRFADRLEYDDVAEEIIAVTREAGGEPVAEPDTDYRRRLGLYRSWSMPTRATVGEVLNGPGAPATPNSGALSGLGLTQRFVLEERNNPFAVAVHIVPGVGAGGDAARKNFFQHLGATRLIWPATFAADDPHTARLLSGRQRTDLELLRQHLRDGFDWTQAMAVAPALAEALERVGQVIARLLPAPPPKLAVTRAFDHAAGSRYELGLGVDIDAPSAALLDSLHAAYTAPGFIDGLDAAGKALFTGLVSKPAAEDARGAWLFEHCGLPTVHVINAGTSYLSTLPTFGLLINESALQPGHEVLAMEALYQAPGDPGTHVVLEEAIAASLAEWAAAGEAALTRVALPALATRWQSNFAQPPAAHDALLAAGLPAPAALAPIAPSLDRVPPELLGGIELDAGLAAQIAANQPGAAVKLRALVDILRKNNVSSALPVFSAANQLTLVVAAIGLPEAGINLTERRTSGFRWYAVPIEGAGGTVSPVGARAQWRKGSATLTAIVVVGYARRGLVDPYEYRVDLPEGATLTLAQYEFLMNALERLYPLGVQINTFAIRWAHVELKAGAGAQPLPPAIMRTYRKFQRRHRRGETSVGLQTENPRP